MDHQRFDDLTRALAARGSRRGVLKGLAAAAVAGLAGTVRHATPPVGAARTCSPEGLDACLAKVEATYVSRLDDCEQASFDCTTGEGAFPAACGGLFAACRTRAEVQSTARAAAAEPAATRPGASRSCDVGKGATATALSQEEHP